MSSGQAADFSGADATEDAADALVVLAGFGVAGVPVDALGMAAEVGPGVALPVEAAVLF